MTSAKLESATQALIEAALRAGADSADSIAMRGASTSVDVRAQTLEHAERAEQLDIGLRVLVGQRQAVVASSHVSGAATAEMAERAVAMAREAPEDPHAGLADPKDLAKEWDAEALAMADPALEPAPDYLQDVATRAEAAALDQSGISQVQQSTSGHSAYDIHLAASNGFSGGYQRTENWISCSAITGTGTAMERDASSDARIYASDLRSPEDIGTEAATRALARSGSKKPPTGAFPVLFDERIASSLIGHLLTAINGSSVARGASWLRDAMGQQVLPAGLDVIEDPLRPRVGGSRPFDGEGLPTTRRALVQNGKLQSWTLDLSTARQLDLAPTGNAARGTSGPPSPRNWNISLTQGNTSKDDLIRDMGAGLIVTSMIGSTINPNTGDYSRGVSGHWVENGEVTYPVNECTIAGNLRDMLLSITPANDARAYLSRVVPSLLVSGMTLAGN
ncbi:MAG: TldD/PmbA family protein [Paracoccaceae bacterium]